ncbi:hypothetical protein F5X96DRAFT_107290 [Biscogniauxia mediterranea]|nr:hypothetical protein F5X96DRAFT_107290 [Biscogniauxia mediterranea]
MCRCCGQLRSHSRRNTLGHYSPLAHNFTSQQVRSRHPVSFYRSHRPTYYCYVGTLSLTIHEIYERIFDLTSDEDETFAHAVIKWLYYPDMLNHFNGRESSFVQWDTKAVLDAALPILGQESTYDVGDLRDICGCLIRTYPKGKLIQVAHFTVKEYMESHPAF